MGDIQGVICNYLHHLSYLRSVRIRIRQNPVTGVFTGEFSRKRLVRWLVRWRSPQQMLCTKSLIMDRQSDHRYLWMQIGLKFGHVTAATVICVEKIDYKSERFKRWLKRVKITNRKLSLPTWIKTSCPSVRDVTRQRKHISATVLSLGRLHQTIVYDAMKCYLTSISKFWLPSRFKTSFPV
jgi:hypothetical protein